MPHEKVLEADAERRLLKLVPGHDREGSDVRTAQFGIVIVMVVVGAAPDAARAQSQDAHHPHQDFREPRMRQDGVVLLIVKNHEQPQDQQAAQNAADPPPRRMKVPMGAGQREQEQ